MAAEANASVTPPIPNSSTMSSRPGNVAGPAGNFGRPDLCS